MKPHDGALIVFCLCVCARAHACACMCMCVCVRVCECNFFFFFLVGVVSEQFSAPCFTELLMSYYIMH